MWCKHCRQDVPGVSSPHQPGVQCTQCGCASADEACAARLSDVAESGIDLSATSPAGPQADFDQWKVDQQVRHWQARLGQPIRFDGAQASHLGASRNASWHAHQAHRVVPAPHRRRRRAPQRSSGSVLFVLSLGVATFLVGGALVAGSFVLERPDLWSRGLPLAIAGQVGILLALALQLERLWAASRSTARKLNEVDEQLEQLGRHAEYLRGPLVQDLMGRAGRPSSSHVMLSDLKDQLDRLASSIARHG